MSKSNQQRISKELSHIINYIRIEFIKRGRTPPSARKITEKIARGIKKEELLYNEFIRL